MRQAQWEEAGDAEVNSDFLLFGEWMIEGEVEPAIEEFAHATAIVPVSERVEKGPENCLGPATHPDPQGQALNFLFEPFHAGGLEKGLPVEGRHFVEDITARTHGPWMPERIRPEINSLCEILDILSECGPQGGLGDCVGVIGEVIDGQLAVILEGDMQDHTPIQAIEVVSMLEPSGGSKMDFDVSHDRSGVLDLDEGMDKIGSRLTVPHAWFQYGDVLVVHGSKPLRIETLVLPEALEKAFGDEC